MNREFVIIPHGNQMKTIRELQTKLCLENKAIPTFPLFVRFEKSLSEDDSKKIKSANVKKIQFLEKEIFLYVSSKTDSEVFLTGKIKIGHFTEKNDRIREKELSISFPVFKISEVEFTESDNKIEWKIFSEKWVKGK